MFNNLRQKFGVKGKAVENEYGNSIPGLTKIGEVNQPCNNPSHNPPTNIYLEPGIYEYVCPGCGEKTTFQVYGITC
jgi:hypothetical protein